MSEMCFRAEHDLRASLSSDQIAVIVELYNRMTTECKKIPVGYTQMKKWTITLVLVETTNISNVVAVDSRSRRLHRRDLDRA